jgi:predicted SPOUT superfamily RNA methylase MTH1
MLETSRRPQQLSIALPASFTRDIPHLREKTSRAGMVARALAIFRVDEAFIYNDRPDVASKNEGRLLHKLLAYQETPQYLRRKIYPQDSDLQFAGILPPLRLPSHPSLERPKTGLVREALVIETGVGSRVDAGFGTLVTVASKLKQFDRVTVRLSQVKPQLEGVLVNPSRLPIYWGYRVHRTDSTLGQLIRRERGDLTISTSRQGRPIREVQDKLRLKWKSSHRTLVLFGSPDEGVPEILGRESIKLENACDFNVNTIPNQGVETVRTEEALIATLSLLNLLEES